MTRAIGAALLIIPMSLSGCSAASTTIPITAPPLPTATASAGQDCGTVSVRGPNPPSDPASLLAEDCFFAAYAACLPATLTLENHGVDVTSTTKFTIRRGSPCGVEGTTATLIVPRTRQTSSFTCARMTRRDGGLLLVACGDVGDIFVPAPRP